MHEPFTPLSTIAEDYSAAVLHLAWNLNRETKQRTLLCGAVELLPHEVPAPLERPERHTKLSRRHFLFASDRVVTLAQGLEWFEQARSGSAIRPNPDGSIGAISDSSPRFEATIVDEEPRAPLLATAKDRIPFLANWHQNARVRHLVARSFRTPQLWRPEELVQATAWLKDEIHFDLTEFPEHWGAIHLIAPNPIFRSIRTHLDRSQQRPTLAIALDLRHGKTAAGLQFEFESKSSTGTLYCLRTQLQAPAQRITLPGPPEECYERVYDHRRGILYQLDCFILNYAIHSTINLSTTTRQVQVRLADGSPGSYEVNLLGSLRERIQTGETAPARHAITRLRSEALARAQRARARAEQRWFRDQVKDATAELRALVTETARELWIADPYFEGDDLLRVVMAVPDPEVPINILAGADHLRSKNNAGKEHCEHLAERIREAEATGRCNPIAVRVMLGSPPPLHDRFMLIDSDLWMLGSSLNAFGARGTILLKVPHPEPVIREILRLWNASKEFVPWLTSRQARRGLNVKS